MRSLAHAIVRSLESGQALELVTVLTASGSTPRGPEPCWLFFRMAPPWEPWAAEMWNLKPQQLQNHCCNLSRTHCGNFA